DMDANGILSVSAKDKGTGKEQSIRIEAGTGLSKEDIERMKAEAEANAEADEKARARVEKLNAADQLIFQTDKQVKEYGDKIPADKKEAIESALTELKDAHKAEDMDKIESVTATLTEAWNAASQDIYQAQQAAAGDAGATGDAGAPGEDTGAADDVEDVEFEEVDK
ncbi:MAG: Hsp70 family protein, partial [Bacteroidota bacterium]